MFQPHSTVNVSNIKRTKQDKTRITVLVCCILELMRTIYTSLELLPKDPLSKNIALFKQRENFLVLVSIEEEPWLDEN